MMVATVHQDLAWQKHSGYYDNWGLDVQIAAGTEITEALGTGKLSLEHIILHIC